MSLQSKYDEIIRITAFDMFSFNDFQYYDRLLPIMSYVMDTPILSFETLKKIMRELCIIDNDFSVFIFSQYLWKLLNNKLNINSVYKIEHDKNHVYDLVIDEYRKYTERKKYKKER